jgi:hypothetical protein
MPLGDAAGDDEGECIHERPPITPWGECQNHDIMAVVAGCHVTWLGDVGMAPYHIASSGSAQPDNE